MISKSFRLIIIILLSALVLEESDKIYASVTEDLQHVRIEKIIRVGSEPDYPPYCIVNEQGIPDGFSVDLFKAVCETMGIKYEFTVDSWAKIKAMLSEGQLDALPLVGRTPEREAQFDFSFTYLTMHGCIIIRDDETEITKFADLEGRQIAVMENDNAEEYLHRTNLNAKIVPLFSFEDAILQLSQGHHDAVVVQKLVGIEIINKLGLKNLKIIGQPFEVFNQSFCFAVKEGDSELLSLLNEGLSLVIADGTFQRLHTKWFSSVQSINQINRKIIVGGDFNYPPFEFIDKNNLPAGYNVDLVKAVARQLGVEIEIRLGPWDAVVKSLKNNEIDLIMGMNYSLQREKIFSLAQAHTYLSQVVVVRKDSKIPENISELKGKSIIVQKGDIMHEYAIEMGYEDQLIVVVSQDEALRLLATGNYDCALVAKIIAHYWIDKNKWKNLIIGEKPILSSEYCFAFPTGNEALVAQFSESLAALKSSGEHRNIYSKWLGVYEKPELGFIDIVRYSLFLLIPIIVLLVGVIVWNRSLGRMVRKRTAELQNEIEFRSLAEKKLIERGNEIELLLNSTAEAIYGLDLQGNCSFVNNSCVTMLGYRSHSDLIGKNMHELIHYQNEDLVPINIKECEIYKAVQSGQNIHVDDEVLWRADGTSFHAEYWSHPQFRDGEITGAVVTFLDVSERKKSANERLLNEEKLVELNATKDKFFSLIAHDLKNPIGTIISFLDLLKTDFKTYDNDKIERFIGTIHQAANHSYELLENLLVWGQSQTGRIENVPQALDIRNLVEESVKFVKPQAAKKKIKIETSIEKNDIIFIDRNLVQTVLRNLLSNAVKYSNFDDKIIINVITVGGSLLISVKDNGIGMTAVAVEKLFKIDKTQSLPGTANEKGTGLGLLICHEFVDKIGGKISVTSAPGKGSDFQLYLPLKT